MLLLEGHTVKLPRPINQFSTDLKNRRENTIPFSASSKAQTEYFGKYSMRDEGETESET